MRFLASSPQHQHIVQLDLPKGSTLTEVTLRYYEDSTSGSGQVLTVDAVVSKRDLTATDPINSTQMAAFDKTDPGTWPLSFGTTTISNASVSEDDIVYLVVTTTVSNTNNIGIAGVTIEYTTDLLD